MGWTWSGHRRSLARGHRALTRYLLDTNIISDIVRNPQGAVVDALVFADDAATSVIVAGELKVWVEKNNSARLERLIRTTLVAIPVLPLSPEVAETYGRIRVALERMGTQIGANDLWIAAHALALDAVMVTDNVREFERVPGLAVQNWLRGQRT